MHERRLPVIVPRRIQQPAEPKPEPLPITVLFTSLEETAAALRSAKALAGDLDAAVQIIVTRVIPFPLPLTSPQVPVEFTEQQVAGIARTAGIDAVVRVYDCRDREEALMQILPEHSVVVMSARRYWFPTKQSRLARLLRQKGHEVVLVSTR
jgi:hypothetical protein